MKCNNHSNTVLYLVCEIMVGLKKDPFFCWQGSRPVEDTGITEFLAKIRVKIAESPNLSPKKLPKLEVFGISM